MSTMTEPPILPSNDRQSDFGARLLEILLVAASFAFFFLVVRNFGAIIFPDENTYSMGARHQSFSETGMPNYLYYAVYSLTSLGGENFHAAAQLINSAFYVSAAFFIYAIARMVCGAGLSLFVAILSLFLPNWIYVCFFMPESMYFALFWLFAWLVMRVRRTSTLSFGAWSGAFLGALSLVKVHAIFLTPGLALFMLASTLMSPGPREWGKTIRATLVAAATFSVVKFGGGFAFAGTNGLMLLGRTYNDLATSLFPIDWGGLSYGFIYCLFGHVIGMCLIFGSPLLLLFFGIKAASSTSGDHADHDRVALLGRLSRLVLCFLVSLMAMSSAFSSFISRNGAEGGFPEYAILQARYYSFLYPGFLLAAGYAVSLFGKDAGRISGLGRYWYLVPSALAAYCAATGFGGYKMVPIPHYPEAGLLFYKGSDFIHYGLMALAILSTLLWHGGAHRACRFFLFAFLPLYLLFTTSHFSHHFLTGTSYFKPLDDVAGEVRKLIGKEAGNLAIFDLYGKNFAILQYHIDNKNIVFYPQKPGDATPIDTSAIRADVKWALVVGARTIPKEERRFSVPYVETRDPAFNITLYRLTDFSFSVDLNNHDFAWPVSFLQASPTEMAVGYKMFLPRRTRISIEVDGEAGTPEPTFEVTTPDREAPLVVKGSSGDRREYVLESTTPSDVVIVRRIDGPDGSAAGSGCLPFRRLNLSPEAGRENE